MSVHKLGSYNSSSGSKITWFRGICPLRDHKVDPCACLHSGSVWPFSCKGKSRTKVLQAALSKLWQACYGGVLLTVICSAGCGLFPFMFGDLLDR